MKIKNLVLFFFIFSICVSCKNDTEHIDLHYDYFPDKMGAWVVYKVDSISYNDFTGTTDSSSFYVKELIESVFPDNQGRPTLRIERYYTNSLNHPWQLRHVWKANKTNQRVEKVEENMRFVKLLFPIKEDLKWDGNSLNNLETQEYSYKDIHQAKVFNNISFDSTITVFQGQELTIFTEKDGFEIFAKHIGLIYKKNKSISKLVDGTITNGYDYTYEIISWSH